MISNVAFAPVRLATATARRSASGAARVVTAAACPISRLLGIGATRKSSGAAPSPPSSTAAGVADTTLLERLGGQAVIPVVLNQFYSTLTIDPRVEKYFAKQRQDSTELDKLKQHQYTFLSLAFSNKLDDKLLERMNRGHARLYDEGLDETHFDVVAEHLVGTLHKLNVPQGHIDEVVSVVAPMRKMFADTASEYKAKKAPPGAQA